MEEALISIIVPVYNVEEYLKKCLDSIYELNLSNKEIILVNDGSTDNSLQIAEKYKEKYKENTILITQENKGLSGARNTGIRNSKGDYLLFIDSDDFLETDEAEKFLKEGIEKKQDILIGNYFFKYEKKIEKSQEIYEEILNKEGLFFLEKSFKYKNFTSVVWRNLYKKDFLLRNNLFFEEGILHEDALFSTKALFLAENVGYSKKYFYYYRKNNVGSIMHNLTERNYRDILYIIYELIHFQKRMGKENKYFNRVLIGLYWTVIKNGRIKSEYIFREFLKLRLNFREKIKIIIIFFFSFKCGVIKNFNADI